MLIQHYTYREGADGTPTYNWESFEIAFLDPDFPSCWQAKIGRCDGEPTIPFTGTPIVGTTQQSQTPQPTRTPQPVRGLY